MNDDNDDDDVWCTLISKFENSRSKKQNVVRLTGSGGTTFTIGRSNRNDYVVKDPCVSTVHVSLIRGKDGKVYVEDSSTNGTWLNAKRLRKGERVVLRGRTSLLSVVFSEKISQRKSFEIVISSSKNKKKYEKINQAKDVLKNYKMGEVLGSGAFATVKLATRKSTGERFAMKIVEKKKFAMIEFQGSSSASGDKLKREVDILQQCDHPNIVKCYAVFDTPKYLYILLELVQGGELFDRLVDRGAFEEHSARHIFRQLARAIAYLHSRGISHRDIKPENILLQDKGVEGDNCSIKISDFGMSRLTNGGSFMKTIAGTPQYVAPEILTDTGEKGKGYGKEVDIWSLGVVLYVLLSARMPFGDASRAGSVFEQVKRCEFSFPSQVFGNISDEAIDLIRKLLVKNPEARLNATQILLHPWLTADRGHLVISLKKLIKCWRKRDLAKAMLSWKQNCYSPSPLSSKKRKCCEIDKHKNRTHASMNSTVVERASGHKRTCRRNVKKRD